MSSTPAREQPPKSTALSLERQGGSRCIVLAHVDIRTIDVVG
jgi:hypothetical protein